MENKKTNVCEQTGYIQKEIPGYKDNRTPEQIEQDKIEWKRFLQFEKDNGID